MTPILPFFLLASVSVGHLVYLSMFFLLCCFLCGFAGFGCASHEIPSLAVLGNDATPSISNSPRRRGDSLLVLDQPSRPFSALAGERRLVPRSGFRDGPRGENYGSAYVVADSTSRFRDRLCRRAISKKPRRGTVGAPGLVFLGAQREVPTATPRTSGRRFERSAEGCWTGDRRRPEDAFRDSVPRPPSRRSSTPASEAARLVLAKGLGDGSEPASRQWREPVLRKVGIEGAHSGSVLAAPRFGGAWSTGGVVAGPGIGAAR